MNDFLASIGIQSKNIKPFIKKRGNGSTPCWREKKRSREQLISQEKLLDPQFTSMYSLAKNFLNGIQPNSKLTELSDRLSFSTSSQKFQLSSSSYCVDQEFSLDEFNFFKTSTSKKEILENRVWLALFTGDRTLLENFINSPQIPSLYFMGILGVRNKPLISFSKRLYLNVENYSLKIKK
jgi:hypothetical protein